MARGEQFRKPGFLSSGVLSSAFNEIHTLGGAWLRLGGGVGSLVAAVPWVLLQDFSC